MSVSLLRSRGVMSRSVREVVLDLGRVEGIRLGVHSQLGERRPGRLLEAAPILQGGDVEVLGQIVQRNAENHLRELRVATLDLLPRRGIEGLVPRVPALIASVV